MAVVEEAIHSANNAGPTTVRFFRPVVLDLLQQGLGARARHVQGQIRSCFPLQDSALVLLAEPGFLDQGGKEDRAVDTVHVVKVKFDLLGRVLSGAREVDRGTDHFRRLLLQLLGFDLPLRGEFQHLLWRPDQDAISNFVPVIPMRRRSQLFALSRFVDQLHQTLRLCGRFGLLLRSKQELTQPTVMRRRLSQCLDDDRRLFKFDPKPQMDDGMEET